MFRLFRRSERVGEKREGWRSCLESNTKSLKGGLSSGATSSRKPPVMVVTTLFV